MNIERTEEFLEHTNLEYREVDGCNLMSDYDLLETSIYCTIKINDVERSIVYQSANYYYMNNYNLPESEFKISLDGGADEFFWLFNDIDEDDFEENQEYILNVFQDYSYNLDELHQIYNYLKDLTIEVNQYAEDLLEELKVF